MQHKGIVPLLVVFLIKFMTLYFFSPGVEKSRASPNSILSLESMERAKQAGAVAWNTLVENQNAKSTDSSCWQLAIKKFRVLSATCSGANESIKMILALTLTECHMRPRSVAFPVHTCRLNTFSEENLALSDTQLSTSLENWHHTWSHLCVSALSETAFSVYVQFFNHIDNICFYLQSTAWQHKTEETVNRLTQTSDKVVSQLNDAKTQNDYLLEKQKEALEYQQHLSIRSQLLREELESGHSSLQTALASMHDQVHKEQQRVVSGFQDVLLLVGRIAHLQQAIAGRLSDVETAVLYATLVIVTYYLTAAHSTRLARGRLYALWTLMLSIELLLWRCLHYFGLQLLTTTTSFKSSIKLWRTSCISSGIAIWFITWWRYRDSTSVIVNVLQSGLQELKDHFATNITPRLAYNPHPLNLLPNYQDDEEEESSDDSEVLVDDTQSPSTSEGTESVVSETISIDDEMGTETKVLLTPRRNPPRISRPRAYRPPTSRYDFKMLHLNPQLWFETSEDFAETVINKTLRQDAFIDSAAQLDVPHSGVEHPPKRKLYLTPSQTLDEFIPNDHECLMNTESVYDRLDTRDPYLAANSDNHRSHGQSQQDINDDITSTPSTAIDHAFIEHKTWNKPRGIVKPFQTRHYTDNNYLDSTVRPARRPPRVTEDQTIAARDNESVDEFQNILYQNLSPFRQRHHINRTSEPHYATPQPTRRRKPSTRSSIKAQNSMKRDDITPLRTRTTRNSRQRATHS